MEKYGTLEISKEYLGDTKFDTLDCTEGTPEEIAKKVLNWLRG